MKEQEYEQINHPNGVTTWKTKPKDQPEALRLADALDFGDSISVKANADNAAAELRRLHALNQELLIRLKEARELVNDWGESASYDEQVRYGLSADLSMLDAAIAKAQGAINE